MQGSVIKRMYAGFALIIVLFIVTVTIMTNGMHQIHSNFETVSSTSLPLVSLSNQTSVQLLSADKSFKDFLTTQDQDRMAQMRQEFGQSQQEFGKTLSELEQASRIYPALAEPLAQLRETEQSYFAEANEAMNNYEAMFTAQAEVQKSSRRFQKLHTELTVGMKEYVDDQTSISVKVMAKSYFIKLKDAEVITSDALASSDLEFVEKAVTKNKKAVTHLNYAYRGLVTQLPSLKEVFNQSVEQFTQDVGQKAGCLTNMPVTCAQERRCTTTSPT